MSSSLCVITDRLNINLRSHLRYTSQTHNLHISCCQVKCERFSRHIRLLTVANGHFNQSFNKLRNVTSIQLEKIKKLTRFTSSGLVIGDDVVPETRQDGGHVVQLRFVRDIVTRVPGAVAAKLPHLGRRAA